MQFCPKQVWPAAGIALWLGGVHPGSAATAVGPYDFSTIPNAIMVENAKAGTAAWRLTNPATHGEVEGYASLTGVNRGGQISFFVTTTNTTYALEVYRMGWYGGLGARQVFGPANYPGYRQVIPQPDPTNGLVECAWTNPATLSIPATPGDPTDWASGAYLARLTGSDDGKQSYIVFAVRDDARASSLLVQLSFATYQAYNPWGGKSLYDYFSIGGKATRVSFNRPFGTPIAAGKAFVGSGGFLENWVDAGWEYDFVRWLEREGYDVSYCSDVDTHSTTNLLWSHQGFVAAGHDEYWSYPMRWHVQAARDRGVNLGFFGANDCYWQVRYEPSGVDGASNRTMVCYKGPTDPVFHTATNYLTTTVFRFWPVADPESALLGVSFDHVGDRGDLVVNDPNHWIFAGTGLRAGQRLPGLMGSEADATNSSSPPNVQVAFASPYIWADQYHPVPALFYCHAASYAATNGAMVFASGSWQWLWGLDDFDVPLLRPFRMNPHAQQITRNILARLANAPAPSASLFFRTDVQTGGDWPPAYGVDGYWLPNDATNLPGYAGLSVTGAVAVTYANLLSDTNALVRASGPGRYLGGWSSPTNMVLDLNLADGANHLLALYFWDWDRSSRSQRVDVVDAGTGNLLDSRVVSSFTQGQWWIWQLQGHVQVRIARLGGPDCLANAIVFGTGAAANFVMEDAVTHGNYTGRYGTDGMTPPGLRGIGAPYATMPIASYLYLTNWDMDSWDPRALPQPYATNRVLAAWAGDSYFDLKLYDNRWHQLAIYCVDLEDSGRRQVVSLFDAESNEMLDSRVMTNFAGGKYMAWNVRGNLRLQVQGLTPAPAVVNAVFWDPTNQPPTVSLASPVPLQSFYLPTNITLNASALDPDGAVSQVSFYAGSAWLGTVTNPPFTFVWSNALVGQYDLTAVAVDDRLASATSAPVSILVDQPLDYKQPAIAVTSPTDGTTLQLPTNLVLSAWAVAFSAPIVSVQFLVDGAPYGSVLTNPPFALTSASLLDGPHTVQARLVDAFGVAVTSAGNRVTLLPAAGASSFLGADNLSAGAWNGLYGQEGYMLANLATNLPLYAQASPPGSNVVTWGAKPNDPWAMQIPGDTNWYATAWYGYTNCIVDITLLDGNPHRVTVYLLDRSGLAGPETIQVTDAATGLILDTRAVTNFGGGIYLTWDLVGHVQISLARTPASLPALVSGLFFDPPRSLPAVRLLSVSDGQSFAAPTNILISAVAWLGLTNLSRVDLLLNNTFLGTALPGPRWSFIWSNPPPGSYSLQARVVDLVGNSALSGLVTVTVEPAAARAVFALVDANRQGNWRGVIGQQGYFIADDSTNAPAYLVLSNSWPVVEWAVDTADPRALQRDAGTGRVAAAWYSYTNLVLDFKCTDASWHRLGLYFLDWYNRAGPETVDVWDVVSGAVLDHKVLPPFGNGVLLAWDIRGHTRFLLRRFWGYPAVVSGVFLDPSPRLLPITIISPAPESVLPVTPLLPLIAAGQPDPANVTHVDFYEGTQLLGSVVGSPPYQMMWTNAPAGRHEVFAQAVGPAGVITSGTICFWLVASNTLGFAESAAAPGQTLWLRTVAPVGTAVRLEAATNVGPGSVWVPVLTNTSTNLVSDVYLPDLTNYAQRFYRLMTIP